MVAILFAINSRLFLNQLFIELEGTGVHGGHLVRHFPAFSAEPPEVGVQNIFTVSSLGF